MSTESTEPRWYCLSREGLATLCIDEEDAKEVAAESLVLYPQNGPYRAVQMVEVSAVARAVSEERERCAAKAGQYAQRWWSRHCASNKHMETTRAAHDDFCALQVEIRRTQQEMTR